MQAADTKQVRLLEDTMPSPITTMSQLAEQVSAHPDCDFTQKFIVFFSLGSLVSHIGNDADRKAARDLLTGPVLNDDRLFTAVVNTQFLADVKLNFPDCYGMFTDKILDNDAHFCRIFTTINDFCKVPYDRLAQYINKICRATNILSGLLQRSTIFYFSHEAGYPLLKNYVWKHS